MGGLAGRADAMFGAVECQKSTGSLHYHFFLFVQRLHQYASMKEIAELLEKRLVSARELKDFLSNISCESYSDVKKSTKNVQHLKRTFQPIPKNKKVEKIYDGAIVNWVVCQHSCTMTYRHSPAMRRGMT